MAIATDVDIAGVIRWALVEAEAAPRRKPPPWGQEEDEFLRANLGILSEEAIGAALGRTATAVHLRWKRDLGLSALRRPDQGDAEGGPSGGTLPHQRARAGVGVPAQPLPGLPAPGDGQESVRWIEKKSSGCVKHIPSRMWWGATFNCAAPGGGTMVIVPFTTTAVPRRWSSFPRAGAGGVSAPAIREATSSTS